MSTTHFIDFVGILVMKLRRAKTDNNFKYEEQTLNENKNTFDEKLSDKN